MRTTNAVLTAVLLRAAEGTGVPTRHGRPAMVSARA